MENIIPKSLLTPAEHDTLITRYAELQTKLIELKEGRVTSGETTHTEPLTTAEGDVNEKFVDFGWTDQIEGTEAELSVLEQRINDHLEQEASVTQESLEL